MGEMKINISDNLADQRERAEALLGRLSTNYQIMTASTSFMAHENDIALLASALADERRRVWEEAALAIVKRHKSTDSDKWLDLASEMKTYTADGFNPQAHAGQEVERLTKETAKYKALLLQSCTDNTEEYGVECKSTCNSYGHAEDCPVSYPGLVFTQLRQQLDTARQDAARLQEALRFYADPQTYGISGGTVDRIIQDAGKQAQKALKGSINTR